MTSHLESRVVALEAHRPRSRGEILRKARAAEQRIAALPEERQQQAWHEFYLDYSSAELQTVIDGGDEQAE